MRARVKTKASKQERKRKRQVRTVDCSWNIASRRLYYIFKTVFVHIFVNDEFYINNEIIEIIQCFVLNFTFIFWFQAFVFYETSREYLLDLWHFFFLLDSYRVFQEWGHRIAQEWGFNAAFAHDSILTNLEPVDLRLNRESCGTYAFLFQNTQGFY